MMWMILIGLAFGFLFAFGIFRRLIGESKLNETNKLKKTKAARKFFGTLIRPGLHRGDEVEVRNVRGKVVHGGQALGLVCGRIAIKKPNGAYVRRSPHLVQRAS